MTDLTVFDLEEPRYEALIVPELHPNTKPQRVDQWSTEDRQDYWITDP